MPTEIINNISRGCRLSTKFLFWLLIWGHSKVPRENGTETSSEGSSVAKSSNSRLAQRQLLRNPKRWRKFYDLWNGVQHVSIHQQPRILQLARETVKNPGRILVGSLPMKTIQEKNLKNLKNADEINDVKTLRLARGRHRLRDQSSVTPRSKFKPAPGLLQMNSSTTTWTCQLHPDIWKHLPTTRLQLQ